MAPTKVVLRLELSEDVLDQYGLQFVKKVNVEEESIEDFLAQRLVKCISHNASRGLYFNDSERSDLEALFGGHALPTALEAIAAGKNMASVTVGGVTVQLDQTLLKRAASRAGGERVTIEQWLAREITVGLERATGIR